MTAKETRNTNNTSCADCPLQTRDEFRKFCPKELEFITRFKTGELSVDPGATILVEGSHSAHLFTVLSGWGFRYKTLEDGRRQILNFVMPGDLDRSPDVRQPWLTPSSQPSPERYSSQEIPAFAGMTDPVVN